MIRIETGNLVPGVYFLELNTSNKDKKMYKFVVTQ